MSTGSGETPRLCKAAVPDHGGVGRLHPPRNERMLSADTRVPPIRSSGGLLFPLVTRLGEHQDAVTVDVLRVGLLMHLLITHIGDTK